MRKKKSCWYNVDHRKANIKKDIKEAEYDVNEIENDERLLLYVAIFPSGTAHQETCPRLLQPTILLLLCSIADIPFIKTGMVSLFTLYYDKEDIMSQRMKLPLCAGDILWSDRTEQGKAFNCETAKN